MNRTGAASVSLVIRDQVVVSGRRPLAHDLAECGQVVMVASGPVIRTSSPPAISGRYPRSLRPGQTGGYSL
jgi:hypothetical protein